jgi:membrane-associated phospholipid phosphatase
MFTLWSAGYFLVAHLTGSLKMHTLMLDLDRRIPFKEEYVWFYLTVYMLYLMPFFVMKNKPFAKMVMLSYISVLVIHYTLYFVFPVTFPREIPDTGKHFSIWALKMVYNGDTPWNCFPSSHCAMALMAALVLLEIDFHFGMYGIFIALTIGISTVFIKQHYIVDVIAGYGVTLLVYYAYFKGKIIDILNTKQRELMQRMESAVESRLEEIVRRVVREELARHGVSGKQDSGGDKRQA